MADERQPLIEIPDDDTLVEIATQAANGQLGTESDGSDLPDWDLAGDADDDNSPSSREAHRRTPIHGTVTYARVPLNTDFLVAFGAADEQRIRQEGEDSRYAQLPEAARMAMYLKGLWARDMAADEFRPPDQKVYWLGGLFRGATYRSLIVDTHMRDFDKTLKEQFQARNRVQFERARKMLGPEWTDEAIAEMLGTDSALDEE